MRKKLKRNIDLENGDTLVNMLDYLCSKVDWKKSYLDADAVACMNTLYLELQKQTEKIKP